MRFFIWMFWIRTVIMQLPRNHKFLSTLLWWTFCYPFETFHHQKCINCMDWFYEAFKGANKTPCSILTQLIFQTWISFPSYIPAIYQMLPDLPPVKGTKKNPLTKWNFPPKSYLWLQVNRLDQVVIILLMDKILHHQWWRLSHYL